MDPYRGMPGWFSAVPPFRRMMIFVDGENLVCRYQAMVAQGWQPRTDGIVHVPDVLVWHESFSQGIMLDEVVRATYYTYVVGDDNKVRQIQEAIKVLVFSGHRNSVLPKTLTPVVFKKPRSAIKAKGVDIQLTVDVLNHVHRDNVDTVLLLSGDGDYLPVIAEVQRSGKQCWVTAFSNGLNEQLKYVADKFYCLDGTVFTAGVPQAAQRMLPADSQ